MSNISFLSHIGCFVMENFLSEEFCEQIQQQVQQANLVSAAIVDDKDLAYVDEGYRKTKVAKISKESRVEIFNKMLALKPVLEKHFEISLGESEKPEVLVYREGDFFKVHKDQDDQPDSQTITSNRKVSVIIFLNTQSLEPQEDCYGGGSLNLYGLINQPGWEDKGFPLGGKPGLLLAFRSNILHEVTPVTFGKRFTIVNWFH